MSVYGAPRPTTPRAEALAQEGILFERAYTSSPDTRTALASLLTGRYGPEHGAMLGRPLDETATTLAEILKQAGYATHAVSSQPAAEETTGLLQGFDSIEQVDPADNPELDGGAAEVTRRALSWLKGGRDRSRPFFVMLVYSSPLLPFGPPEGDRYRFVDPSANRQRIDAAAELWVPFARRYNAGEVDLSARDLDALRDLYDAEMAYADARWGEVVAALRSSGELENAVVAVTSLRGEDLGEAHRLADSTSLREANLRVPLILRLPKRASAGVRVRGLAQDVDLLPTICAAAGLPRPATAARLTVSHLPADGTSRRAAAVSIAVVPIDPGGADLVMSSRDDRWRYVLAPSGPVALFDLEKDPEGNLNVLAETPSEAARMQEWLRDWDSHLTPLKAAASAPAPPGAPGPPASGAPAAAPDRKP